jgi:APA family basic amino acid/polyamine antiporter
VWAATALVVGEVVGVGIFLSPATMVRTLGSVPAALAIWGVMGLLTAAGALCYAELSTRFPKAGGSYVFLREAYGPRVAFVYGWMALLVMDPGLAAALGIGLAQYLLVVTGGAPALTAPLAVACIVAFGLVTLAGLRASASVMRWSAVAKLAIVAVLVGAGLRASGGQAAAPPVDPSAGAITAEALAASFIAAFFAFGGWWELGRMSEEVEAPRRTLPRALLGGVALVTGIYVLVTVAFMLVPAGTAAASDDAFVSLVGRALFGEGAARLLAAMVVVAVAGSLAAVLVSAPRVYVAMARDGLFPRRLARFDEGRGTVPAGTLIQIGIGSVLALFGTFNQILGFFVPAAVFFLGLSAAAVLRLPRPAADAAVFRVPLHPLPVLLFLLLIVSVLALFAVGQPTQMLLGAAAVALGVPVSFLVLPPRRA